MIVSDSEEETDQNLAKSKENSKNSNDDSDTKRYLNVVDVCTTRELFFTFREDLKEQKSFGICLACTPYKKVSEIHVLYFFTRKRRTIHFFVSNKTIKRRTTCTCTST